MSKPELSAENKKSLAEIVAQLREANPSLPENFGERVEAVREQMVGDPTTGSITFADKDAADKALLPEGTTQKDLRQQHKDMTLSSNIQQTAFNHAAVELMRENESVDEVSLAHNYGAMNMDSTMNRSTAIRNVQTGEVTNSPGYNKTQLVLKRQGQKAVSKSIKDQFIKYATDEL